MDLALHKEYVRGKLVDYLNHLLDLGVAGFRVDTSKHMWPGDMKIVFGRLKVGMGPGEGVGGGGGDKIER